MGGASRAVLKGPDFFLLRTALKDHPKGPPTANRQLPPTANRRQPPTANRRQPPTATNRQPSTAANRHQPPITNCQLPPTAANRRQPPTANRQPAIPPAANRLSPPTMVEHMSYTRSLLKKPCSGTVFFHFSVKDRPGGKASGVTAFQIKKGKPSPRHSATWGAREPAKDCGNGDRGIRSLVPGGRGVYRGACAAPLLPSTPPHAPRRSYPYGWAELSLAQQPFSAKTKDEILPKVCAAGEG